jgi:UTP-glucose-1-phosphate uridylyltransferase
VTEAVCILTAGMGTRMGPYSGQINKALLPLDGKAIISHIVGSFTPDHEFVIGLGYLGDQVRKYFRIAHPDAKVIFVEIDNFDGAGSGPGYSLFCCKPYLQRPFYFVSCDTLWTGELPSAPQENWLGVASVPPSETGRYCNLKIDKDRVTSLLDKVEVHDPAFQAFVGLCYIRDFGVFWRGLGDDHLVAGERQVSNGLTALIASSAVRAQSVTWTDVGDIDKYKRAVLQYADYDFSKSDEFFYTVGGKVIKYFADHAVSKMRVEKAGLNPAVFPRITDHAGGFYAYDYQPGDTLYKVNNVEIFSELLQWLEKDVWKKVDVPQAEMRKACDVFYRDKTLKRLADYKKKYAAEPEPDTVNGTPVPGVDELIARVPWETLGNGVPAFMHGDLQFDNILFDSDTARFTLLDWRQDFAGKIAYGDLYYDLAKLRGGIILKYDLIKRNLLEYSEIGPAAFFDFAQRYQSQKYLEILEQYVVRKGLDAKRVRLLTACIYLNMSPLHHYPFDKMLHALGRVLLHAELSSDK